jgi:hypothetical protein
VGAVLNGLRRQPSLRYAESGRDFLRWISIRAVTVRQWSEVIERSHCIAPRRPGSALVRAVDFDDWADMTIVDGAPGGGDAVEALHSGSWLCCHDHLAFAARPASLPTSALVESVATEVTT